MASVPTFSEIYRDWNLDGNPLSLEREPPKSELRAWGTDKEIRISDLELSFVDVTADSAATAALATAADIKAQSALDTIAAGIKPDKQLVRVLLTTNVAIATALESGDTADAIVLATGNRVALTGQTAAAENGVYVVQASGAAIRAADMDSSGEIIGARFSVSEGTHAGTAWSIQNTSAIIIGTTPIDIRPTTSSNPTTAEVLAARGAEASLSAKLLTLADARDVATITATELNDGAFIDFTGGAKIVRDAAAGTSKASALIGSGITLTRATTRRVIGRNGKTETIAANQLGLDYDMRPRRPLGLHLSEAVNNLFRSAQPNITLPEVDKWNAIAAQTAAINQVPASDAGGNTAMRYLANASNTNHGIQHLNTQVTPGAVYTFHVRVRRETLAGGGVHLIRQTNAVGVQFRWQADGSLLTVVTHGAPIAYGWRPSSDTGYYDVWMTLTAVDAAEAFRCTLIDATGLPTSTQSHEYHFEAGWLYLGRGINFNLPYNTTVQGATARDALALTPATVFPRLGKAGTINLSVGQWYERATATHIFFDLRRAAGNEKIIVRNGALGEGEVVVDFTNAANVTATLSLGTGNLTGFDLTLFWSPDGVGIRANGVDIATDPLALDMALADTCFVGPNGATATTNAIFKTLRYWPYVASDAEISGAGTAKYQMAIRAEQQVIIDQAGAIVSPAGADVSGLALKKPDLIGYDSGYYDGKVRGFRQRVPGATAVIVGTRKRLEAITALGQSLSIGSTSVTGSMVLTAPLYAPAVVTFPIGPHGAQNAVLSGANIASLVPAQSVVFGTSIKDTPILAMAYGLAQGRVSKAGAVEPILAFSAGVGGMSITDLAAGGASNSWLNAGVASDGHVARAAELDMTPVQTWALFNQGEANSSTDFTTWKTAVTTYFGEWRALVMGKTGQTETPKIVIQQIGSRLSSGLPSGICEIPLAQIGLSRDVSGVYIHPNYWAIHNFAQDSSHVNSTGYVLLGELSAILTNRVEEYEVRATVPTLTRSADLLGVRMTSWEVINPTTIDVTFNVPFQRFGDELEIDTANVPAMPNYGFQFLDSGTPITISSVTKTAANKMRLVLSTAYDGAGGKVRLGFTNTVAHAVGSIFPGTNIRSTWEKPSAYVAGVTLRDWALLDEI